MEYIFKTGTPIQIISKTGVQDVHIHINVSLVNIDISSNYITYNYNTSKVDEFGGSLENQFDSDQILFENDLNSDINFMEEFLKFLNENEYYTKNDWYLDVVEQEAI